MTEKLAQITPEIVLFAATCLVMVVGLSRTQRLRQLCGWIAGVALVCAAGLAMNAAPPADALFPELARFAKVLIGAVGLLLLTFLPGVVDREVEERVSTGAGPYEPLRATRAEFFAFFLFSLTGLMLCASADDLIWLFLALELTSLPTYVMVTISTRATRAREAGVKYFFLGALGAAIFLYGFALLYGSAGTTSIPAIAEHFARHGVGSIGLAGVVLSILGLCFKIAAVPMHFYVADVYQGAHASVSAMLGFVPKAAGMIAIVLVAGLCGWRFGDSGHQLPEPLHLALWIIAVLTMTIGNVMATVQDSVKRMLAYSSVAHSGYMLVGVLAGPGDAFARSGLAAAFFYLLCYGVMNTGVFGAIAALEKRSRDEVDSFDDLRGLSRSHPLLAAAIVVCTLSLLGFPPLLGFIGKFGLFTSAVSNGLLPLVIILGINSAIAAFYYLRLIATVYLDAPGAAAPVRAPFLSRPAGALVAGAGVIALVFLARPLMNASFVATVPADDARAAEAGAD